MEETFPWITLYAPYIFDGLLPPVLERAVADLSNYTRLLLGKRFEKDDEAVIEEVLLSYHATLDDVYQLPDVPVTLGVTPITTHMLAHLYVNAVKKHGHSRGYWLFLDERYCLIYLYKYIYIYIWIYIMYMIYYIISTCVSESCSHLLFLSSRVFLFLYFVLGQTSCTKVF